MHKAKLVIGMFQNGTGHSKGAEESRRSPKRGETVRKLACPAVRPGRVGRRSGLRRIASFIKNNGDITNKTVVLNGAPGLCGRIEWKFCEII